MDQREFNNGMSNLDALDTDGGDVAALLRALPRVEAPKNFDFRVKARIAEGSAPRGWLIPVLKLTAPLSLVLIIAGLVIFYGTLPGTDNTTIADTPSSSQLSGSSSVTVASEARREEVLNPVAEAAPREVVTALQNANLIREASSRPPRRNRRGGSIDMPLGGGSREEALRSAEPILPRGFEAAQPRNLNSNTRAASSDVSVRSVLGILGITGDPTAGGWKVQSLTENSIALRSGVLVGDVIEAIDGQQLKGDSVPKGTARTLTIRRGGKTLSVDL